MSKWRKLLKRFQLRLLFGLAVFLIMLTTMMMVFFGTHLLARIGYIEGGDVEKFPLFLFCLVSVLLGTVLSIVFSKAPLRPFRELMDAIDQIASGDYHVRLHLKGTDEFRTLSEKFNHMAEELGSVEMLRSDFVGNFSHEFKTPIVSIRGFAKALKWNDVTPEEREEYLDIIIAEAERLSELSINVLYLSQLENQPILTEKKRVHITEQMRRTVALFDQRFSEKRLVIDFDAEEVFMEGNAEMMQQVWVNLLDNAMKFSPVGGTIGIRICQLADGLSVKISNQGEEIPPKVRQHLFDKFYQGDASHATNGNGLGLSIVKRIVDLHGGKIAVRSSDKGSTFEVILQNENRG